MTDEVGEPTHECIELVVDVQIAQDLDRSRIADALPSDQLLSDWASNAYRAVCEYGGWPTTNEVTIRLVSGDEIEQLNGDYRGKNKVTNVLSFPFEAPLGIDVELLGDVVICHDVVMTEAAAENKKPFDHYAHMVTHGVLHLCGYDHQCDTSAHEMESLEIRILANNGYPNPYL